MCATSATVTAAATFANEGIFRPGNLPFTAEGGTRKNLND
jgi:hypothetical protein